MHTLAPTSLIDTRLGNMFKKLSIGNAISPADARVGRTKANEAVTLRAEKKATLHIACGLVWITRSENRKDYWLRGGDSLDLEPNETVVLEAQTSAVRWSLR